MKLVLCTLLALTSSAAFANQFISNRIVSTDPHPQKLTAGLNFGAAESEILNQALFHRLFDTHRCESSMLGRADTSLKISVNESFGLDIILGGRLQTQIAHGEAKFIPEYFSRGRKYSPHYMVKMFDKTLLHISIQDGIFYGKTARISKVEIRDGERILVPILEASGY